MPDTTLPNLPTRLRQMLAGRHFHYTCPGSGQQAYAVIATEDRLGDLALAATTLEKAEAMAHECAALIAEADALRESARIQTADLLLLQRFAADVLGDWPELGDMDGHMLQQSAYSAGLLTHEDVRAPCGPVCSCADAGVSGATRCYRVQPALSRALAAACPDHPFPTAAHL